MSGYSFSHQFYQRWMQAPDQIRGAIIQELKDIMTLLQTDTVVSEFQFTQSDLDSHLDELYAQDETQKAAAEQARLEKEAKEAKIAAEQEKERLRQEILEKQRLNRERLVIEKQKERGQKEQRESTDSAQRRQSQNVEQAQTDQEQSTDSQHNQDQTTNDTKAQSATQKEPVATLTITPKTAQLDSHSSPQDKSESKEDLTNPASEAYDNTETNEAVLSADQESFVHELEERIDDYLSEQMAKMSEDLKSWLRDEVQRQLARSK